MTIAVLLAILACKVREASNIMSKFNWIKLCSSLPRAEQKLSRPTERERGVCACWESKTSRSTTGDSWRLNKVWALYFMGKSVTKGVCNVAKLATLRVRTHFYQQISMTFPWLFHDFCDNFHDLISHYFTIRIQICSNYHSILTKMNDY